jgi:hypothetical protein
MYEKEDCMTRERQINMPTGKKPTRKTDKYANGEKTRIFIATTRGHTMTCLILLCTTLLSKIQTALSVHLFVDILRFLANRPHGDCSAKANRLLPFLVY